MRTWTTVTLALLFSASHALAQARPTKPNLSGKTVHILYAVDLDGDGDATELESQVLAEELRVAGVKVERQLDGPPAAKDVLVLGDVAFATTYADRTDPAARAKAGDRFAAGNEYRRGRDKLAADARAAGATVVPATDVARFFDLGPDMNAKVANRWLAEFRRTVDAKLPPARQPARAGLADAVAGLADVSDSAVEADWESLRLLAVHAGSRAAVDPKGLTVIDALARLGEQVAPGKTAVVVNREGVVSLMSKERAAELRSRRPQVWLSPEELRAPPAEFVLPPPPPEPLRPLGKRMIDLRFADLPLADALDQFAQLGGPAIEPDWTALARVNVQKTTLVTARTRHPTVARNLKDLARALPGGKAVFYVARDGKVHLTSREAAERATEKAAVVED
jgi:hypothetical protein